MIREYTILTNTEHTFKVEVEGTPQSVIDRWVEHGGIWNGDTFIPWHCVTSISVKSY